MSAAPPISPPARWRWLLPAAGLVALVHFSPLGPALDHALLDFASRHPLRPAPVPEDSALVLVDDATMDALGATGERWPFPRATFAALLAALERAGAARIAVDLTFFDHSDSAEQDLLLAVVAGASPGLVLAATADRGPVFWDEAFRAAHPDWFASPRTGQVVFTTDADGVARRYALPGSLADAVADPTRAASAGGLLRWAGGLEQVRARGVPVLAAGPFIGAGRGIITRVLEAAPDLDPAGLAAALAAEPLLTGPLADAVRGRVVFVGANASGTFDIKPLPVGGIEPGVLLHWTAWANATTGSFITPWPRTASLLAAALGAGALLAAARRRVGLTRPVTVAVALAGGVLLGAYAGLAAGWFLAPATPVLAVAATLLGVVAERYWSEQARKRELQAMFGAYVDPAVVARLVANPAALALRGERREATVFFSDLAGFTDLSEKLPPERMVEVVNAYLDETSECLHRHGAYVDKYIGDAVMAVFGVPQDLPDHALAACRAALEAQRALTGINARYADAVGVRLAVRIGLNTGELIAGNVGSARKRNYTVMGDSVNLASRLEGANKHFGTTILLGPVTAARVAPHLAVRPLARLRVKGKQEAVEVFTLHGDPATLPADEREFLAHYHEGYAAFAARRFPAAAAALARAERLRPADQTTLDLRAQAEQFVRQPPPPDWEPVLILDSK